MYQQHYILYIYIAYIRGIICVYWPFNFLKTSNLLKQHNINIWVLYIYYYMLIHGKQFL